MDREEEDLKWKLFTYSLGVNAASLCFGLAALWILGAVAALVTFLVSAVMLLAVLYRQFEE